MNLKKEKRFKRISRIHITYREHWKRMLKYFVKIPHIYSIVPQKVCVRLLSRIASLHRPKSVNLMWPVRQLLVSASETFDMIIMSELLTNLNRQNQIDARISAYLEHQEAHFLVSDHGKWLRACANVPKLE